MNYELPVFSTRFVNKKMPFEQEFLFKTLYDYLFYGKDVITIEQEYFHSEEIETGAMAYKVLEYFNLIADDNSEPNKGFYLGRDLHEVCAFLKNSENEKAKKLAMVLEKEEVVIPNKMINYYENVCNPHAYSKIYYGVPGCGKSYKVSEDFSKDEFVIKRTTFHPEYANSDFIGQIIPKVENEKVKYNFHPGAFTLALQEALEDSNKKVCLIIEEINRGNASAIFGDIFQLLDRDENGISKYGIYNESILEYLKDQKLIVDEIRIPSNMWVIGTMNTSDQNVFTLDTAFKRRWKMEYIKNVFADNEQSRELRNKVLYFGEKYSNITWEKFVRKINRHILEDNEGINGEDKQLGVYFVTVEEIENKKEFAEKILSYLWEDVAKLNPSYWFGSISSYEELLDKYNKEYLDVFDVLFEEEKLQTTGE